MIEESGLQSGSAGNKPRHRFSFSFDFPYWPVSAAFGITPRSAYVDVDPDRDDVHVRFGPWALTTPLHNIAGAQRTGGFKLLKTIGPPHISFSDKGLTMATNSRAGVCLQFHDPVAAALPIRPLRHPGLTVTVADCEGLIEAVLSAAAA